jgi:hypothetical protein
VEISIQQEQQFVNLLKSGDYHIDLPADKFKQFSKNGNSYYLVRKLELFTFFLDYCRKLRIANSPKEIFWQRIKGMIEEHIDQRNGAYVRYYLIPIE